MVIWGILGAALLFDSLAAAEVVSFEANTPGKTPPEWSVAMTHDGAPPRWEIVRDESAPSPPYIALHPVFVPGAVWKVSERELA
jgi:hypothetical protein